MKEIQLESGRSIIIRVMDKSSIIPGGEGRCPANCDMIIGGNMIPDDGFKILSEKMIEEYGSSAILALDKDHVIGFVGFFPAWCPRYDICNDEQIEEALKHIDDIEHPPQHPDPVLYVNCLVVKEQYRGNNISIHLLNYLKDWARAQGWRKIVAHGCIFSGRAQYQWLVCPKPPKPIWEEAGFLPGDDFHLAKTVSSRESAKCYREWYREFEFPDYVPRDVDPDDPDWCEIFRDYTMICDLRV